MGVYLEILRTNGIECEVALLPAGFSARYKLFKRAADFDGVFLHKKGLNVLDAFFLRKYSRKLIYNFDDAVMYSDKNPERYSRSHFVSFRRSVRLADMVITGSNYLAEHARKFNSNVEVLPIGLKVSDYRPDCPAKADDKIRLVWIGSRSTLDYLDEIKPAIKEIAARFNQVVLRIICDNFPEWNKVPIEKRLWSMDTRGIELATSDIGLAPLPDNRFTQGKCSFKVLEYSAAGLPVVASPVGTNSDYVKDGVTGFLAAGAREWIDRITQLVKSIELRQTMGRQGRAYAETFDVGVIGERLTQLIMRCLA